MRKLLIHLIIALLVQNICLLYGQTTYDSTLKVLEKVTISTNNNLYVSGDKVSFAAFCSNDLPHSNSLFSSVLYLELIKPDGTPVIQKKYRIQQNLATGEIILPNDLYSGIYYLKAYTKWMRNFDVTQYAFKEIKVINTQSEKLLPQPNNCDSLIQQVAMAASSPFNIDVSEEKCMPRSEIILSISQNNQGELLATKGNISLSVIKSGSKIENISVTPLEGHTSDSVHRKFYNPELEGITVSGKVLKTDGITPVNHTAVYLSQINKHGCFFIGSTDQTGYFHFNLPGEIGENTFLVFAENKDERLSIILDNDFCQKSVELCPAFFELSPEEKELALELNANLKITSSYSHSSDSLPKSNANTHCFYGAPNKTVYTDNYIHLPTIQEFLLELVPEFIVTNRKGKSTIRTKEQNTFSPFPVLLLHDNVPLDLESLLDLKTERIERIELIDQAYIINGYKYSGIVHAISSDKELNPSIPANATLFNYDLFSQDGYFSPTVFTEDLRWPYRPNIVHWSPEISLNDSSKACVKFIAPDVKGSYKACLYYIDQQHNLQITTKTFQVK